ncbi:MAG: type II toxin-antitoxin system RelE/ParE family toxin [Rhodanobacteraceae bacterium]|nr:type II toxin-antitoxin system RelE/ParE family toxin [Rhodanobacteraceae bacterium]
MPRVELTDQVAKDFKRIADHLLQHDVANAALRVQEIMDAIGVLEHNPRIGRPTGTDLRELVIGRDSHGYMALYRHVAEADIVLVLAIRAQREAGYFRDTE